jgi:tRNA threonylcarbamoyladenosine biosynthesis protein TsaB
MLILAIDTSWKHGSVALGRGDKNSFDLLEVAPLTGGAFSAELVPQIAVLLARRNLRKQAIDGFAATSGPGSFTGLRVGLAAIKGLVEVLAKPIATISVLEAVAIASGVNGRVFAALDAQRREVFLGEYEVRSGTLQATALREEALFTREEFVAALPQDATVVTPDASIAMLALPTAMTLHQIERPGADWAARIGLRKILAGQIVSAEALDANYVRRSDAEIFSAPKK